LATLAGACDAVVSFDGAAHLVDERTWPDAIAAARAPGQAPLRRHTVRVVSRGLWVHGGALLTWEDLRARPRRLGLLTALARPSRVERALARRGIVPSAVVCVPDHGPFGASAARAVARFGLGIDLWVVTSKCALHTRALSALVARRLPELDLTARLAVIDHDVCLDSALRTSLHFLVP
jgi:hypothetical protein